MLHEKVQRNGLVSNIQSKHYKNRTISRTISRQRITGLQSCKHTMNSHI